MHLPDEVAKAQYRKKEKEIKIIVFDFECSQAREQPNGKFKPLKQHEVVLAVARKVC